MKRDKHKSQADRHALLAAAALQDHMARRLRMPGGPVAQPSLQPGAPMTLAQHLGLIPRPPPLLTEDQWTEVHLRSRLRQDSSYECVICREEFQAGAQVLLSCSHTFHRHCLASFERFSGSKSCPLCRAQQYQKKLIRDGEEIFRGKCATRIQAAWRGFVARRGYLEYRRHHPPRDEQLKKKWAAKRLQEENDRLLSAMDDEVGDLDDLFAELDASVAQSRAVCDAALRPLAARLQQGLIREAVSEVEAELPPAAVAAAAAAAGGSGRSATAASSRVGLVSEQGGRAAERFGLAAAEEEEEEEEGDCASSSSSLSSSPSRSRRRGLPLLESGLVAPALAHTARTTRSEATGAAGSTAVEAEATGRADTSNTATATATATAAAASTALMYRSAAPSAAVAVTEAAAAARGRPATAAEVDWDAVVARARARGLLDCPICLGDISRRGNEGIAWLSCTHCFHLDCIMAFEAFELASGGALSCPVCRSGYRRRCFAAT
ncbi:hypothetical protein VOLCADRAFT_120500 [Volvox carteri f. nagariensis]|uniref:Uncharacterized protein mot39 n=1 Tax=Volvox carteri f. nagariensis TaxID=3068 RepID=D8TML8_VOLCA|nr:uncharacterized protein VOLCADRAFT_120500 [Volvox carteri f. nagariensis]EFJ51279.1 hypothetical protein VOLCADRAFT_120500 [Volvox carteri f. nagariensis]|eukprot:XP_002947746.1 hypothetical protein VOLCADRAFT_120500 [Volvox carteri f. nagariensis]